MQEYSASRGFAWHIARCHNTRLPGGRVPFLIGETPVGWLQPSFAEVLASFREIEAAPGAVRLLDPGLLQGIARTLAGRGFYRWRGEAFDVRAGPKGPVLAEIDRGALPSFGLLALGVHVNGLVRRGNSLHLWVGRRAANKHLDPDKLDHVVAGGVPAGHTSWETLLKEAEEEAAIPPGLAQQARLQARIGYAMERPEGLRRDLLYCYDLMLPESFEPRPVDGEVARFELWPLARVFEAVRDTDQFKFNVNLVLIDLFLRLGLVGGSEALALRVALDGGRASAGVDQPSVG